MLLLSHGTPLHGIWVVGELFEIPKTGEARAGPAPPTVGQQLGATIKTLVVPRSISSVVHEGESRKWSVSTEVDPKSAINFSGFQRQSRLQGHYKKPRKQGTSTARPLKNSLKVAPVCLPRSGAGY